MPVSTRRRRRRASLALSPDGWRHTIRGLTGAGRRPRSTARGRSGFRGVSVISGPCPWLGWPPCSVISGPVPLVLGPSSVTSRTSSWSSGLPFMTARWVGEDHRRGYSDRDGPDGKREARAAVNSSQHEISPLVRGSEQLPTGLPGPIAADVAELWRSCVHLVTASREPARFLRPQVAAPKGDQTAGTLSWPAASP